MSEYSFVPLRNRKDHRERAKDYKPRGAPIVSAFRKEPSFITARRALIPRGSTNQQAMRTGGWANPSQMSGELKFNDNNFTISPGIASNQFFGAILLNGIAPGTSASQRIGRKAVMKTIFLRCTFRMSAGAVGGSPCRILVVYDKQANAAAPVATDILAVDQFQSPNNLSNRDRFVTIFDQMTDPISDQGPQAVELNLFKKINLETMWNAGTDALIGSIASGSIYIFAAQVNTIATASPVLNVYARVRYADN